MSIGRLYHLRKLSAAHIQGLAGADIISGSSLTYHNMSGSTITVNLATTNRIATNQISGSSATFHRISGSTGLFNLVDTDRVETAQISGSTGTFHRVSGSTGTYNLIDSDRIEVADLSGSTARFNTISGSASTFHKMSGSFVTIKHLTADHISTRTFNSSVTTEQHLEIKNMQIIAAVSQSAGVVTEGAGLQIGGTAGTGSDGIASIVLGDAGGGAGSDLLIKIGSTQGLSLSTTGGRKGDSVMFGVSGSISGSIGVLQDLEVNRETRSKSFSGSIATIHTISGSSVTFNFIDTDRGQIADLSGSTAVFNTMSGSGVTIHHLSASTSTFNFVDIDRASIADVSGSTAVFNAVSGSGVTVHHLSASTSTFNFIDVDRASVADISGSTAIFNTVSGSGVTIHHLSASTSTFNFVDIDRAQISDVSGSTAIFNTVSGSGVTAHHLSASTSTFNFVDTDRAHVADISGSTIVYNSISGSGVVAHHLSSSTSTFNFIDVDRAQIADVSGSTAVYNSISGSGVVAHHLSSSTSTFNLIDTDRATIADMSGSSVRAHTITSDKGIITSLTSSGGVTLGSATSDDIAIHGGIITNLYPQNTNKVDLGFSMNKWRDLYIGGVARLNQIELNDGTVTAGATEINLLDGSRANEVVGGTAVIYGQTGQITGSVVNAGTVSGSIFNVQKLNVYGEISGSGTNTLIKKQHIHKSIAQNNTDSHGGLSFDSGRLSVGWRKRIFVRSDGSNISGSVPTKGMYASHAIATPYTTASIGGVPMSGSLMVYLNGLLLHSDHPGENPHGPTAADYRINTSSASSYTVLLNEELALDSDDILTVTYLSGSGFNS